MTSELVITDRAVPRILAVIPAIVVAVCVRVLTLGTPPVAARVAAAAVVALSCWIAYRLLTVKVTLGDTAIHVRGVFYDADLSYDELETAVVAAPGWAVRALMWGVMRPHAVELRTRVGRVRPIALVSTADDEDVHRILRALLVRCGTRLMSQRDAVEQQTTSS
jgi:hypothetical protein